MSFVRAEAYAKINLSLDIVGKRNDGYHFMDMVMQSVNLCDTLELKQLKAGIDFFCSDQSLPKGKDNLAVRAASAFLKQQGYLAAYLSVSKKGFHPAREWLAAVQMQRPF